MKVWYVHCVLCMVRILHCHHGWFFKPPILYWMLWKFGLCIVCEMCCINGKNNSLLILYAVFVFFISNKFQKCKINIHFNKTRTVLSCYNYLENDLKFKYQLRILATNHQMETNYLKNDLKFKYQFRILATNHQ